MPVCWRGWPGSAESAAGSSSSGSAAGVRVYDDYAHHPTKVAAALRGARQVLGHGRLLVAFQPHLYSRTRDFAAEFGIALALADVVLLLDVYGARENPLPGVTGALIAQAVPLPADRVLYEPHWAMRPDGWPSWCGPVTCWSRMGAGDVTVLGPLLLAELAAPRLTRRPRRGAGGTVVRRVARAPGSPPPIPARYAPTGGRPRDRRAARRSGRPKNR